MLRESEKGRLNLKRVTEDPEKEKLSRDLLGVDSANAYHAPITNYDEQFSATPKYIACLPDLANGLPCGAPVPIQRVGYHNFKMPLHFAKKEGGSLTLETSITGSVSLSQNAKGINMSRIMRGLYKHKDEVFHLGNLAGILNTLRNDARSDEVNVSLKFSYPIEVESLRSGLYGYQYYDVTYECQLNSQHALKRIIHFDFVYSSACPCSFELAEHARKYRGVAGIGHSQRSVARISLELYEESSIWIEDIREIAVAQLRTETQVMVKREDEQAFAELNGSYPKFVEDAARLLVQGFTNHPSIKDFKIVCVHLESLHSHDAVSVIVKGLRGGFSASVDPEVFANLIR
jgi:GTP cyclohydrolase I